jgi:tRNA wybutosine-synthesizing protein 2
LNLTTEKSILIMMRGKIIGDIMVVKTSLNEPQELLNIPKVNRVVKLGHIRGFQREPEVSVLWGKGTETIHKENHCHFKLDVGKIMWSKGNTTERIRMAKIVNDGEIVVDLFAGIGYFSIPMAVHNSPQKIYSVEINPVAYHYLQENVKINHVNHVIDTIWGNCREVAPRNVADRVLMGYIGNTHDYLDVAMEVLREGGIIHYHEAVPQKLKFNRPVQRIKSASNGYEVEIIDQRVIKKYSPGVNHVVVDARIY